MLAVAKRSFSTRRQVIYEILLPAMLPNSERAEAIEITPITLDNVAEVAVIRTSEVVDRFRGFLREGQVGVYARQDSRVVGHAWAVLAGPRDRRVNGYFFLKANEALVHQCLVEAAQRGRGIFPAMLRAMSRRLFAEKAVQRVILDTERDNAASQRAANKAGFRALGWVDFHFFRNRFFFRCWRRRK
jgi:RimJ/RimL family protein N-acetyltransferase